MSKTDNLIRATDFAIFLKGARGEWIPYPESGKIYSTVTQDFVQTADTDGYQTIAFTLTHGGRCYRSRVSLHRALWVLCRGIPLSLKAEVDHIDGNRANNVIGNLRLISNAENVPHKLSFEAAEEIRRRHAEGESQTGLAKEFGVSRSSVRKVLRRETFRSPPEKMPVWRHF